MTQVIPMVLHCPECRARHVDVGEFATKVHHTHSCQGCGLTWRPAVVPTVGVQFLPGFKNVDALDAARAQKTSGTGCNVDRYDQPDGTARAARAQTPSRLSPTETTQPETEATSQRGQPESAQAPEDAGITSQITAVGSSKPKGVTTSSIPEPAAALSHPAEGAQESSRWRGDGYLGTYEKLEEIAEHCDGDDPVADAIRDVLDIIWFERLTQNGRDTLNARVLDGPAPAPATAVAAPMTGRTAPMGAQELPVAEPGVKGGACCPAGVDWGHSTGRNPFDHPGDCEPMAITRDSLKAMYEDHCKVRDSLKAQLQAAESRAAAAEAERDALRAELGRLKG